MFVECKWQDMVSVDKILQKIREKSEHVRWHNSRRKERYAIFAKSFKQKIIDLANSFYEY